MNYNRLSPYAREVIRASGRTIASYVRSAGYADGEWHGDYCGCKDDRCIGYHHDGSDYCKCLEGWLDQLDEVREAHDLWHAYRAAVEANDGRGDQVAYDAAWERAERWVRNYFPRALTFSLDAIVPVRDARVIGTGDDGWPVLEQFVAPKRGISITYPMDPRRPELYTNEVAEDDHVRQLVWCSDVDEYGLLKKPVAA